MKESKPPLAPPSDLSSWGSDSSPLSSAEPKPGLTALKHSKGVLDLSKFLGTEDSEEKDEKQSVKSSSTSKTNKDSAKKFTEDNVYEKVPASQPAPSSGKTSRISREDSNVISDWGDSSDDMLAEAGEKERDLTTTLVRSPTKSIPQTPTKSLPKSPLKSITSPSSAKYQPRSPVIQRLDESDQSSDLDKSPIEKKSNQKEESDWDSEEDAKPASHLTKPKNQVPIKSQDVPETKIPKAGSLFEKKTTSKSSSPVKSALEKKENVKDGISSPKQAKQQESC